MVPSTENKYLYFTYRWNPHRVDLELMAKKGYFPFPKAQGLESHRQMV